MFARNLYLSNILIKKEGFMFNFNGSYGNQNQQEYNVRDFETLQKQGEI